MSEANLPANAPAPGTNSPDRSLTGRFRAADKRLKLLLLSTALLLVPQVGQLLAVREINLADKASSLSFLFLLTAVFFVPTAVILTAAILYTLRSDWRKYERLFILGGINLLIALNLTWFFINQCSWAQVFGLALKGCTR